MMQNPMRSVIARLCTQTELSAVEINALMALQGDIQSFLMGDDIIGQDQDVRSICVVVDGIVARAVVGREGSRQITAFYVAGELPDLNSLMIGHAAFALIAGTDCRVLRLPHTDLAKLVGRYSAIMEAFWRCTVWDASTAIEWVANIGNRPAAQRIAHLICELAVKTHSVAENEFSFDLPLRQSVLAEATGLSVVHVNRSLQLLRKEELVWFTHRQVCVPDWLRLEAWADFNANYLASNVPKRLVCEDVAAPVQ
jgi:CRP-like cAMP-binding protein